MNTRESDSGTKLFALCMFIAVDIFKRQKRDFFKNKPVREKVTEQI